MSDIYPSTVLLRRTSLYTRTLEGSLRIGTYIVASRNGYLNVMNKRYHISNWLVGYIPGPLMTLLCLYPTIQCVLGYSIYLHGSIALTDGVVTY